MSRKNTLITQVGPNAVGPQATSFSLTTSFTSSPTVVRYLDNCSVQINVTTTDSVGTFQLQVSNDYYVNEGNDSVVMNPGNWVPLTLAGGTPFVAAQNDNIVVNLNQLPFYALRLAYISTTPGTGTCTVYISDKAIGS